MVKVDRVEWVYIPDSATAAELVRTYLDEVIADLDERLELAKANAEYLLELACEAALVDDTPEGARRLGYKLVDHRLELYGVPLPERDQ